MRLNFRESGAPGNSQILNCREIRQFVNLRENKVVTKIKCYTVVIFCIGSTDLVQVARALNMVTDRK